MLTGFLYHQLQDGKQKCFHVVEKSTGYSIRTSTGNMEQAIFRRSKNGPEAGRYVFWRFYRKNSCCLVLFIEFQFVFNLVI